jgi:hypothetical protein
MASFERSVAIKEKEKGKEKEHELELKKHGDASLALRGPLPWRLSSTALCPPMKLEGTIIHEASSLVFHVS